MADLGSTSPYHSPYNYQSQSTDTYSQFFPRADSPWFVDSGATNHITTNLNNLSLLSPYQGIDKVTVGDDKALHISHVGVGHLHTQSCPKSVLSLPNVLHVPHMRRVF